VLQEAINALILAMSYTLFASGMSLAWGTVGILNFAHGATFVFAAFVCYLIVRSDTLPLVALALIGIATGAATSAAAYVAAFGPILRRRKDVETSEMQILAVGIGIATILEAIASHVTESEPFGLLGSSFQTRPLRLYGARITNLEIILVVLAAVVAVALIIWLYRSRVGLALRAIGVDDGAASLMGINRSRMSLLVMAIGGALAGLAGVLLTLEFSAITPESGDDFILKAFAAIVLGGLGSLPGTIIGCFVLAVCETIVLTNTSGQWVDAVSFGVIIIVLLIRPSGLFGRMAVRRT
jgi:branched-chain amino acid transport system permease protein